MKPIILQDLGTKPYKEIWDYQEQLLAENCNIKKAQFLNEENAQSLTTKQYFLLVEHSPVFTLGKNGKDKNILVTPEFLQSKGIDFYHINRGGDITFHGLGQIVGYPILDLEKFKPDLGWYLRNLEEVIIETLMEYGITADRSKGETGVWLDPTIPSKARKICAIGIKCSRWITMHGFALNVNTDLSYFNYIIPCGIENKQVTTLQKELGKYVSLLEVKKVIINKFEKIFNVQCK